MEQLTLFDVLETEIPTENLTDYVGQELHHYDSPENWLDPKNAPDEYITLLSAERRDDWMKIKIRERNGREFYASIRIGSRSRLYA